MHGRNTKLPFVSATAANATTAPMHNLMNNLIKHQLLTKHQETHHYAYIQQQKKNTSSLLTWDGIEADRVYVCCLPDLSLPPGNT